MTGRMLNKHPDIFTFNELHFYEQLWKEGDQTNKLNHSQTIALLNTLLSTQRDGYFLRNADPKYTLESEEIIKNISKNSPLSRGGGGVFFPHEIYKSFLNYEVNKNAKKIGCEQTPRNVYYVDSIATHFTNPKFLHIVRDPRDVLLSQKNRWKRRKFSGKNVPFQQTIRQWINYHPLTIGKLWMGSNKMINLYKNESFYYIFKYENLLTQAEEETKKICDFIGVSFHSEMVKIPHIGSSLREDKPGQLGIDKTKINGWKKGGLNNTEIYICQKICKNIMLENGYEIEKVRPNPFLLLYYYGIFPIMGFMALLFSFNRVKNLRETFKRRFN
jgi:hypothetical protein